MKNVKIIILIFFALTSFKALSQTFNQETLTGWANYELADLNCNSKMHCAVLECSTLYPSPSQALQYMNCIRDKGDYADDMPMCFSDLETDTRGCLVGNKSAETSYNGGFYWQCTQGTIKIGCTDDNADLPSPVCGEKPKECENGNPSGYVRIGDSYVWTCSLNDKTEICEADKDDLYPKCDTQTDWNGYESPGCINGEIIDDDGSGNYKCKNEWATKLCYYDPNRFESNEEPVCGSSVNTCDEGDATGWDGRYIHYCTNKMGSIGCDYTPPICDHDNYDCVDPAYRMGGLRETSTQYNWTCRVINGQSSVGFQEIAVDRDCSEVKPISPPPSESKCYEYEKYMETYEDVPFECQRADRDLPTATETSPSEIGIIKNRPYAGFGNCYIDRYTKNEIACDSPAVEDPVLQ